MLTDDGGTTVSTMIACSQGSPNVTTQIPKGVPTEIHREVPTDVSTEIHAESYQDS